MIAAGAVGGGSDAMAQEIVTGGSPQGPAAPGAPVTITAANASGPAAPTFAESPKPKVVPVSTDAKAPARASAPASRSLPTAPAAVRSVSARSTGARLPFTGLPVGLVAAMGLALLLTGLQLRRRTSDSLLG